MTWAQHLKRLFNIDIEVCTQCGVPVKVIACIEDPQVIKKILTNLENKGESNPPYCIPETRAPPQAVLFD